MDWSLNYYQKHESSRRSRVTCALKSLGNFTKLMNFGKTFYDCVIQGVCYMSYVTLGGNRFL